MNPEHVHTLCQDFDLGTSTNLEESHEGVLNKNYILTTQKGKYFVKSIREKRRTHLPYIAEVEEFMYGKGIPAVCMMSNVQGEKFVEYASDTYTVYPYIESLRTHHYTVEDFERIGLMLGRIHKAGNKDVPDSLTQKSFTDKPSEMVLEKLQRHRENIQKKEVQDEDDKLFLKYLDLKLEMIQRADDAPQLPKDTLVHGDYHTRNLLINKDRKIIGVCDWEQAGMNARAYELARSLLYVCFNGESEDEPHVYQQDFAIEAARAFISGYISIYPISNEEIHAGLRLRLDKLIHSFWIEEQYYEHNDPRSNKFIPHEIRLIQDFYNSELLKKLRSTE